MTFTFHRLPVGIDNCFLLRGTRTILIDGGSEGNVKAFQQGMNRLGVDPQEIALILLTHGHWDHIGSLHPIQQITGAKVAVHHRDQAWVESGRPAFPRGVTRDGKGMIWLSERLIHPRLHPVKVDVVLDNDGLTLTDYGIPGRVIYTPGHSPGHVSVVLDSGEAFVGDMAMNSWFLRLTPGLPVLADDMHQVIASWQKIVGQVRQVYPAHGQDFPVAVMHRELALFQKKTSF